MAEYENRNNEIVAGQEVYIAGGESETYTLSSIENNEGTLDDQSAFSTKVRVEGENDDSYTLEIIDTRSKPQGNYLLEKIRENVVAREYWNALEPEEQRDLKEKYRDDKNSPEVGVVRVYLDNMDKQTRFRPSPKHI